MDSWVGWREGAGENGKQGGEFVSSPGPVNEDFCVEKLPLTGLEMLNDGTMRSPRMLSQQMTPGYGHRL